MKITELLVKHLVELGLDKKHLVVADRDDAEVRSFAAKCIVEDKLDAAKIAELSVEPEVTKATAVLNERDDKLRSEFGSMFKAFGEELIKNLRPAAVEPEADQEKKEKQATSADLVKAAGGDGASVVEGEQIRVKAAVERYSHTKSVLTYTKSSNRHNAARFGDAPVIGPDGGEMETSSQRDKAIAGAWLKHMVNRDCRKNNLPVPSAWKMTEHDKSIVEWAARNCYFIGPVGLKKEDSDDESAAHGVLRRQKATSDLVVKALLDDSSSGGLEAVPIEFDNVAVMTSLLNGELMPLVTFRTATRRRMEGYSMGEFTFGSTAEGTAITPFDTSSFIAAFDTTIYPIVGAVEVGLDFLEDSPNDIGSQIQDRYGDGFLKKMDNLISSGSGTNEMLGLFNTSGLTNIDAENANLPYSTSDLEALLFGVTKPYRQRAGNRAVFLSNETVYKRVRAIPHGTADERRIFGMTHEDYRILGHDYKINESEAATNIGFFCVDRYRAYRRAGFSVRVVGGNEVASALKNTQHVVVRARYGGQLELAAAGAIIDDMPTS